MTTVLSEPSGIEAVQFLFPAREITVRDLIATAVREQCRQLEQRYQSSLNEARNMLARQYLNAAEVEEQALAGRVVLAEKKNAGQTGLDADEEITKALRGFEKKIFMILVGHHRCSSLDETVTLALTQPVQFIRIIPLVGG